jgi:hypothetical protein
MLLRLLAILAVLAGSLPAHGEPDTISTDTEIVIFAERHETSNFASEVLRWLQFVRTVGNFDCLFVEYPTDLQKHFDRAVNSNKIDALSYIVMDFIKQNHVMAFESRGTSKEDIDHFIETMNKSLSDTFLDTFAINREMLKYLNENEMNLLAYDAKTSSEEMRETAQLDISSQLDGVSREIVLAWIENGNARNVIMADNISKSFYERECHAAFVVIGSNHLKSREDLEHVVGQSVDFVPLQDILTAKGFVTAIRAID